MSKLKKKFGPFVMKKCKIKKGDRVMVIAGASKGEIGEVLLVQPKTSKVVVKDCAMVMRHTKPSVVNQEGGIVSKEMPIHISNVALLDPERGVPVRVGFRFEEGKKIRYSKKSQKPV